jgi:hypothetical protein
MKIYVLSQDQNVSYDTYDSVVVAAEDEESAKRIHPDYTLGDNWKDNWDEDEEYSWCNSPDDVKVELVGTYEGTKTEPHVILSSFNAG